MLRTEFGALSSDMLGGVGVDGERGVYFDADGGQPLPPNTVTLLACPDLSRSCWIATTDTKGKD